MSRLAEIDDELLAMGATLDMVDDYVSLSSRHMPPDVMPHDAYEKTLNELLASLEDAKDGAAIAEAELEKANQTAKAAEDAVKKCNMAHTQRIIFEQLERKTEALRKQIMRPLEIRSKLYAHLTRFRPIDAAAYFARLDMLVDEKIAALVDMRRDAIREIHHASQI